MISVLQTSHQRILVIPLADKRRDANQLDLFADAKTLWLKETLEIALTMRSPFYFGELRAKCAIQPVSPSWWGALTHKMHAVGFRMTGQFRRSKTGSRKGGVEFQWERIKND